MPQLAQLLFKWKKNKELPEEQLKIIEELPVEQICPNPMQPRKQFSQRALIELAQSIQQYGVIQPLSVRLNDKYDGAPKYELIAGERRLRAAMLLGMATVPCVVITADSATSAEIAIIENLQRQDLNIFEQAAAIHKLIGIYGLTQEQIAARLSVSQSYIANKLRLLRLDNEERDKILNGMLTERHARALLRLEDRTMRVKALEHIVSRSYNVAKAEEYIEGLLERKPQIKRRIISRDIRLFINTLDKAVRMVKDSGFDVAYKKDEEEKEIRFTVTISKG